MPNCFSLSPVLPSGQVCAPASLPHIDNRICEELGYEPHPDNYLHGWVDSIGLGLALGHSWEKIRTIFADQPDLLEIVDYLEKNYKVDAWYERRSRD